MKRTITRSVAALALICPIGAVAACGPAPIYYGMCVEHDKRVDDSRCDRDFGAQPAPNGPHWMWKTNADGLPALGAEVVGSTRNLPRGADLYVGLPSSGTESAINLRGASLHSPVGYTITAP